MNKIALLAVVAACGRSGHPGLGDAGNGTSSDAGDGGVGRDAGITMQDAGVDPASCVVGVADGCCPTAVPYGGHDPDCPSLSCPSIQMSDPIPLDDWQEGEISGVGMAWTGRELVLAWDAMRGTAPEQVMTIMFERRDATGALTYGPVSHDDAETAAGLSHRTPELGFEPTSHALLFASSMLYQRYAETLGPDGAPTSAPKLIGQDCNPIMARFQIYPWHGSFLVAQDNDPCGVDEWHGARVDTVGTDGALLASSQGDRGVFELGMTYDAAGERVVFSGGNLTLTERTFAPPMSWSSPQLLSNENIYDTGVSASGGAFLVVYGTYYLTAEHRITSDPMAGTWTIDASSSPATATPASALTVGANRQTVAPRMVWTGDGWVELMSSFPWEGQGLPASWASFSTLGWRFAPDGSLREAFALDPQHPTYLVNAIWAGGRIAVTYVTLDSQGRERRYLRFLSCGATT